MRVQEYERLLEQYYTKRRTKNQVTEQRSCKQDVPVGFSIDALPIEIVEHSEYLHFPASGEDIRNLLKRMPQGIIDGLDKITLTLGKFEQRRPKGEMYAAPEADPYFGRLGHAVFGGIFRPSCLGTYFLNKNEIKLYGYVYDSAIESRGLWELYLRLHMLQTFVHELAHHYDFTNRVARGKWRMDDVKKCEIYAETVAHDWTREYAIPYIQDAYPKECDAFNAWMKEHAGVVIDLSLLVGDCRATTKNDTIRISSLFSTSSAFEEFAREVLSENNSVSSRVQLATELHYSEQYDISLEMLDILLKEDPKNIDAIVLYGDIYEHQGKYSEAIHLAKKALQIDKTDVYAYYVICDSYEGMEEWETVIKWSCKGLSIASTKLEARRFLIGKFKAESKLQMYDDASWTISEIKELYGKRPIPQYIQKMENEVIKNLKEEEDINVKSGDI